MSRISRGSVIVAKVLALAVILMIANGIGAALFLGALGDSGGEAAPAEPSGSGLGLIFAVFLLQTAALSYPILRSRWHGWRLVTTIVVVFFGTVTFMSQIESLVYLGGKMPDGMLPGLFAMGLLTSVMLAPVAVVMLGRWAPSGESAPAPAWPSRLLARLAAGGLVMLALYYLFGYFIAWQSPVVREYYGGSDPGSFFAQMRSVVTGTPWMLPFQYLRGVLWAAIALLVVRSMKGRWWEAGLALAALFSVPSLYLLMPNPLMPEAVRMVHLVETAPYQFLFGWLAAWWLANPEDPPLSRSEARAPALGAGPAAAG